MAAEDRQVELRFNTTANTAGARTTERATREVSQTVRQFEATQARANTTVTAGGRAAVQAAGSNRNLGRAALTASQAFEDMQFGMRGVLNNIPGLILSLGGGAGLAGAISFAAVSASILARRMASAGDASEDAGDAAEDSAEEFERSAESSEAASRAADRYADSLQNLRDRAEAARGTEERRLDIVEQQIEEAQRLAEALFDQERARIEADPELGDAERTRALARLDLARQQNEARDEATRLAIEEQAAQAQINALREEERNLFEELQRARRAAASAPDREAQIRASVEATRQQEFLESQLEQRQRELETRRGGIERRLAREGPTESVEASLRALRQQEERLSFLQSLDLTRREDRRLGEREAREGGALFENLEDAFRSFNQAADASESTSERNEVATSNLESAVEAFNEATRERIAAEREFTQRQEALARRQEQIQTRQEVERQTQIQAGRRDIRGAREAEERQAAEAQTEERERLRNLAQDLRESGISAGQLRDAATEFQQANQVREDEIRGLVEVLLNLSASQISALEDIDRLKAQTETLRAGR